MRLLHQPWSNQLFTLLPCLSRLLQTALIPTAICICIYSFTYSFTLDFLWIIPFTPPLSPLPPTALSVNKLKFVCHRGGAARRCPSNLTRFITPLIESDQKPIESQSNICISPSSVWFNCQCRGSRFYCRLPEPRHSSLPRNLVSRFTV